MWKKEDGKTQVGTEISTAPASATTTSSPTTPSAARESQPSFAVAQPNGGASISQGIRIKGDVTGSEDLFVDGQVDGKLSLTNGCLTIGPNGQVKADVTAREVIVRGKVEGKVTARDKVLLGNTGQVNGEVQTDRLAIEDGALLRGKVEAGRQPGSVSGSATASSAKASSAAAAGAGTGAN